MAAKIGVRSLFGPYFRRLNFIAPIPKLFFGLESIPKQRYVYTTPASQGNAVRREETKIEEAVSGCPICSRNLKFTYKDVLLLAQFISPEGHILNRRVTGVCRKQQRKLEKSIEISRRMGLIPRKPPALIQKANQMA
ncbi:uncharacterized protein LOC114520141 [Dendronephthya gigantea]|uniref:uncharacterized protein LOC114520141 n=1 Tax=Dendronephthya gigantea TaxID=151771 RepID=UPI0010690896|nr:uncharacterized protein LOC114520141 [Dendronephthya gigantea]